MKKDKKFIIRILFDSGKVIYKEYFTRKGADLEYARLIKPPHEIYDGEKFTTKFKVERK